MNYFLVHRNNKEDYTMQKINVSCGGKNLRIETNSDELIKLFLSTRGTLQKTIPGVTVKKVDNNIRPTEPYVFYMDTNDREVSIDEKSNKAIIKFPFQELFFPDMVYLVLSMLSKELNKVNK